MALPESVGWMEYNGKEIAAHFASLFEDVIGERDRRIEELEKENELLRKQIEVMSGEEAAT